MLAVKFTNLRITVTNQTYIHKEVKYRLNFENAYYQSVHNFWLLLYLKPKIHRTIILLGFSP
jgi:hypothetical protein